MILINNVIVNEDVIESKFSCDLNACKGACCWEGDFGAPLEKDEIETLEKIQDIVLPYLDERSQNKVLSEGGTKYYDEPKFIGTNLHEDGACVYLNTSSGIALCGIEQAWKDNKINYQKPISCHLYPIRVEKDHRTGFETMNYDQWDICAKACVKGKSENVKVYEFAKVAIERKFGEEFYEQLDEAVKLH